MHFFRQNQAKSYIRSVTISQINQKFVFQARLLLLILVFLFFHQVVAHAYVPGVLGKQAQEALLKADKEVFAEVGVIEFKGRALLIGHVGSDQAVEQATTIIKNVAGVKEVISNLRFFTKPIINMVNYVQFEKEIEQKLSQMPGINASNYAFAVNQQGTFILGQASDQKEMYEVLEAIGKLKWAKKIFNFILLDDEIRLNTNWQDKKLDLTAMDNAIYDVIKFTNDDELKAYLDPIGIKKGQMTLIDEETAQKLSKEMVANKEFAGGSSANSVASIQSIGGKAAFLGVTDQDEAGYKFNKSLEEIGVKVLNQPKKMTKASGQCFVFVTPDGNRTMLTYLGASNDFIESDIDYEAIKESKVLLLQAYLLDNGKTSSLVNKIISFAKANNTLVAFALSSVFKVNKHSTEIQRLLPKVDILIGNEKEFEALFAENNTTLVLSKLKNMHFTSVFTMSNKGAFLVHKKNVIYIAAPEVDKIIDQTGAGDAFAGGFLYGFTHGYSLIDAAKLGVGSAKNVLIKVGARPSKDLKMLKYQY